MLSADLAQNKF